MNYGFFVSLPRLQPVLVCGVLACLLLPNCAPQLRYATAAETAAVGVDLHVRHLSVRSGVEVVLRNAGTRPYFLARPDHCSVFVQLDDAQHRELPHGTRCTTCPVNGDPDTSVWLEPGDSLRYALDSQAFGYRPEDLPRARTFEVVYQGTVAAQEWDAQQVHRIVRHTLKASGTLD